MGQNVSKNANTKSKTTSSTFDGGDTVEYVTNTKKRDRYSEPMFNLDSKTTNRYNALWAVEVLVQPTNRWIPSPNEVFATRDEAAASQVFRDFRTSGLRARIAKYLPAAVAKA